MANNKALKPFVSNGLTGLFFLLLVKQAHETYPPEISPPTARLIKRYCA